MSKKIKSILIDNIKSIKRFLTSKDLLVFLVFVFISTALWMLHASRKDYETVVQIPVSYENIPKDIILTNALPKQLRITIVGRGTNLANYRFGKDFDPIQIDMTDIKKSTNILATNSLKPALQKQIKQETQIIRIYPDSIYFKYEHLQSKKVPVKLTAAIELSQQYTYSDSISIVPKYVIAYGPKSILDTLKFAETTTIQLNDVKDTISLNIPLKRINNITYSDSIVHTTIKSELFTENTVLVPISISKTPSNRRLRIFPANVSLNYQTGISNYDKIDASSFSVEVDYNETKSYNKLPIHKKKTHKKAFNIKIKPEFVDYIIEEKASPEND